MPHYFSRLVTECSVPMGFICFFFPAQVRGNVLCYLAFGALQTWANGKGYDNTVHSVNTATPTWRPNIFCIKFLLLLYFAKQVKLFGFLQVMEIVAYVLVYGH